MAWAEKTNLSIEVDHNVEILKEVNEHTAEEDATQEQKDEFHAWQKEEREHIEATLKENREALKKAEKKFEEEQAALKVKNEFAENLDEHLEVSEAHMTRIEQAI